MTGSQAISKAIKLAKARGEWFFVVVEGGEYAACDERELDTYFRGATVLAEVNSSGEIVEYRA